MSAADNAIVPGIQTITRLLALRGDGTRGLYIDPSQCPHTIAEYLTYEYEQESEHADAQHSGQGQGREHHASELPVKAADHAMDATRYALHSERRLRERPSADAYLRDLARWAQLRRADRVRRDGPLPPGRWRPL